MPAPDPTRTPDGTLTRRHHTNKGRRFPPDPIRVDDVAQLLTVCVPLTPGRAGHLSAMRLRALIVLLYRTGLRISEALALSENDLMRNEQAIIVRRGKGGKRRIVMMDEWGWGELEHWLTLRSEIPPGAIICILRGRSAGQPLSGTDARRQLRDARARAGLRRRVNPHSFRHGFSVEFHRETGNLIALQRQLGHSSPTVTGVYLRGIDDLEALEQIARRKPPMIVLPPAPR
jgi:integrase/recombinase XerD